MLSIDTQKTSVVNSERKIRNLKANPSSVSSSSISFLDRGDGECLSGTSMLERDLKSPKCRNKSNIEEAQKEKLIHIPLLAKIIRLSGVYVHC